MADEVFHWNDERVAFLREHWQARSASWIGKRIGCSRSAVISKGHRMALPKKGKTGKIKAQAFRAAGFRWASYDPTAAYRPSPYRPGIDVRPPWLQASRKSA